MNALDSISQDVGLRKLMKRITISFQEIKFSIPDDAFKTWAANAKRGREKLVGDQKAEYFDLRRRCSAVFGQQDKFRGKWAASLSKVFQNLASYKTNRISLVISDPERPSATTPHELKPLQRALRLKIEFAQSAKTDYTINTIIKCLMEFGLGVCELTLPDNELCASMDMFGAIGRLEMNTLQVALSNLCSLDVTLRIWEPSTDDAKLVLSRLLNISPKLQTLKLRTRGLDTPEQACVRQNTEFGGSVSGSSMPSLREADLNFSFNSRSDVVTFIQNSRNLQRLRLYLARLRFGFGVSMKEAAEQLMLEAGTEPLDLKIVRGTIFQ